MMCAVSVEFDRMKILIMNVYMPCDDNRPNHNIVEYNAVLNDMRTIFNSSDAQHVIVGGDFNTDLKRSNYFTRALKNFVCDDNMYLCVKDVCNTVQFTYYSKSSDARSLIDHFIISDNIHNALMSYDEIDNHNNFF